MSYRYLHIVCHRHYYKHMYYLPFHIFISTLIEVVNFAKDRINEENQFYYTMAVSIFVIIAGFIITVAQFLK